MKINKKKNVLPVMRRKVTFIKLKIFRSEKRRRRRRTITRASISDHSKIQHRGKILEESKYIYLANRKCRKCYRARLVNIFHMDANKYKDIKDIDIVHITSA